jgi:hypothetical protein
MHLRHFCPFVGGSPPTVLEHREQTSNKTERYFGKKTPAFAGVGKENSGPISNRPNTGKIPDDEDGQEAAAALALGRHDERHRACTDR